MSQASEIQYGTAIRCANIEQTAILYVCDELDAAARAALETHCRECAACGAVLALEQRLQRSIAMFDQPADTLDHSGLLLAKCRSELSEALDDQQAGARGWRYVFSPVTWWNTLRGTLVYHPALSMLVLIVAGFLAGVAGQRGRVASVPARPAAIAAATQTQTAPKLTDQLLQNAGSANVAWVTPSDSSVPVVQVQLTSQAPMSIVGPPDDSDVQRALTFVLANDRQFDPDARMDSLDVLQTRCSSPDVRQAICKAARNDQNSHVRIKALQTLRGFGQDNLVRQTVLDALQNDGDSGVRGEAINTLIDSLRSDGPFGSVEPRVVNVLRDRLKNDPDDYIRLQSESALRQLGDLP